MAEYAYKARDAKGKVRTGSIRAPNKAQARGNLMKMRLMPMSVQTIKLDSATGEKTSGGIMSKMFFRDAKGNLVFQPFGEPDPSTKDLIIFTRQFATMIGSGVPLIQALGVLAPQQRVAGFGRKLDRIRGAIENGSKLSEALEAYPRIFESLFISMTRAGEASGNLDSILLKLTIYIEKAAKIKSQVKAALFYPAMVLVVAISVIATLLLFVVPTFAKQYSDAGKPLPALTQFVVDMSNFLASNWYLIFGGMFALIAVLRAYSRTPKGNMHFDKILLTAPGFGQLFRKIAVGRFCNTMSTMLTSGVNLLEALTICAGASGNKVIEAFILTVRGRVEQGAPLSEPLAEGGLFPGMVTSMVSVGEATGALDEMLTKVAVFYEEEVDLAVKTLLSMIEPVMIVFIGGAVGFIVIAMYLPVFDLATTVGG